ncbi:MAG: SIR2 family protein, partial [Pseudomonadota bacterium]
MPDEFDADDVGERGFHASGDYSRVREQLRYWPYTTYRIEDTLDIGLIEGKGRQLLFQAINARNLTAFVGSGMSAAYGRLTWSNWQKEQFRVVQEGAERFETLKDHSVRLLQALAEVADPGARPVGPVNEFTALRDRLWTEHDQSTRYNLWRWFGFRRRQVEDAWHRIEGLRATFERSKDGAGFPGGEELPLKFQIAQQLHDQLRSHIRIFMPPAHKKPDRDEVLKNGWPGARIDDESSPPRKGLVRLHESLKEETTPKLEQLREDYTAALSAFCDTFSRPEARVEAQELAKMLLFDERAHSVITLREGLLGGDARGGTNEELRRRYDKLECALKIFDLERLKRDIDGIRDDPDLYRVLGAYQFETLSKLRNKVAAENPARAALWEGFREFEKRRIDEYRERIKPAGDERRFITPSSRFIVAVYLRLLDRPFDMIGPEPGPDLPAKSTLFPELERSDFTSRRSILANRFDPLAKTVRQLGITRYITTNYDVEIERFFQDMGYRKFPKVRDASVPAGAIRPPEDDEYRSDPIGGLLLDQTFNRENASDLVAFSVGDQRKDAAVFHLHGRATAKDDLVITERDYMNLYLLEDEHRDTVNEAITMAFSSAPLVFLGLGMNEADLLRPLRQFMSNRDRTIGYQALAILPGEEQVEKRTKFAVTCFLRYGVHTIFYGSGQIEEFDGGKEPLSIDWLCRILELNKAMGTALDTLEETGERKAPDALLAELAKKVGFTNDGLSEDSDNHIALMALFGKGAKQAHSAKPDVITPNVFAPVAADIMDGKLKLRVCSFTPIRPDSKSRESRHFDPDVFIEGDEFVGFATGLMNQSLRILLHLHDAPDSEGNARDIAALRMALSGLYGALLTGALNAQLVGLEKEWRSWWQKWQQSPPHRFARFEHLPITAKDPLPFHPARFIRHRVSSIITDTDRLEKVVCAGNPLAQGQSAPRCKLP